ncbi:MULTISPECIES: hypothetical protein [Balneolaceae]|uniref:Uncharacterized protein n=1 Tax=Gracilimonas mengyeensis TaxID=1302730 RepID=A0A521D323_9BACT|nr:MULTISPECIES: hypothetical protein [Balneolaceae]SMO66042.1 hypothetical protein SAMN06265219_10757 [Gracilimonas mengyeensis]
MTEQPTDNTSRRFDPHVAADLWRKKEQEQEERKVMNPEKLAEEVSDRLIRIIEKEMKRQQPKKTG